MRSNTILRDHWSIWSAAVCLAVLSAAAANAQGIVQGSVTAGDTNRPLANAIIELRPMPSATGRLLKGSTDTDGQFRFVDVPPGRYVLSARHAGYSPLTYTPVGAQTVFPVKPGESPAIRMRMTRQGSVEGQILGANGRPLRRARVILSHYRPLAGQSVLTPEREVWADPRGRFHIPGVPAGSYLLSATSRAVPPGPDPGSVYVHTFYSGTTRPRMASRIQVADARSVTGLMLQLGLQPGFPVAGRITDPAGSPLAGARVLVRRMTDDGDISLLGGDAGEATTDDTGAFRIGRLAAGSYRLLALGSAGQRKLTASRTVAVGSSDTAHLAVVASNGATVKGRVIFEGNIRPISPRVVRLAVQSEWEPGAQGLIRAAVADDSTFTIEDIPAGPARFFASLSSQSYYVKAIQVRGEDVADQVVDFAHGDLLQQVHVVIAFDAAEFSGAVAHDGGGPSRPAATVVLFPSQPAAWQTSPRLIKVAAATAQGKFVIRGIMPGDYGIVAVHNLSPAAGIDPALLAALQPSASPVRLRSRGAGSKVLHAIQAPGQQ